MTDRPILRRTDLTGEQRAAVEKLRGNALVAAVYLLGGTFVLTEGVKKIVGTKAITIKMTPEGPQFTLIDKPVR